MQNIVEKTLIQAVRKLPDEEILQLVRNHLGCTKSPEKVVLKKVVRSKALVKVDPSKVYVKHKKSNTLKKMGTRVRRRP
jgi:hypothetical protein